MIDKDKGKVLPMIVEYAPRSYMTVYEMNAARALCETVMAQRDADWEIMKRWVEALKELLSVAAHRSGCGSLVTINDRSYLDLERCDCPHGKAVELLAQRDMEVEDDSS